MMPSFKKCLFGMVISAFLGLLVNRVYPATEPSIERTRPVSSMLGAVDPVTLTGINPAFPRIPLPLQPPVLGGVDLTQDTIRDWLSDRSPEIFLTFDDGPSPKATALILDILQEYDVKATFFVLGRNAAMWPELIERIVAEGHELALHSYSHANLTTLSWEQKKQEIADGLALLHWQLPNLRIRWFRPPYGSYDQAVVDLAHAHGMCIAMFNEISIHSDSTVAEIVQTVVTGQGRIIVFHDGQWPRPASLTAAEQRLLHGLAASIGVAKAQGAEFKTLSSHFGSLCP